MSWNARAGVVLPLVIATSMLLLGNCAKDEPTNPNPPGGTGQGGHVGTSRPSYAAAFVQGSDSSSEPCWAGSVCMIQGESTLDVKAIFCGTECGGPFAWFLDSMPPGVDWTIDPPDVSASWPSSPWDTSWVRLRADTNAPNTGTQIKVARVGLNPLPFPGWGLLYNVQIQCSLKRGQCGQIEIVDSLNGNTVVSGAGTQTNITGKPLRLRVRFKPGSGGPDSNGYFLENIRWNFTDSSLVDSTHLSFDYADINRPNPSDWNNREVVSFYYMLQGTYTLSVTADIRHGAGTVPTPVPAQAQVSYQATGPDFIILFQGHRGTQLGQYYPAPDSLNRDTLTLLSFGDVLGIPTVGIIWYFQGTPPFGDDSGWVAGTQTIHYSFVRQGPGITVTNGSVSNTLADGCPTYSGPGSAGTRHAQSGLYFWLGVDAPGLVLGDYGSYAITAASASLRAQTEFMYRPSGPSSIWVPLGGIDWKWAASALKTGPDSINHGWELVANADTVSAAERSAPKFPVYDSIKPALETCDSLPNN